MQPLALTLLLILISALSTAQAAKQALLIGISDYSASGLPNLPGAKNDVERMAEVLRKRFGFSGAQDSITTLLDAQATHRGIAQAFATLREKSHPGDQVFVYYSGHGSQTPDLNGDEPSKAEENDRYDVLDDQIRDWLGQIGQETGEMVIFVSDSCHSGSVSRGEVTVRAAPPADATDHPLAKHQFPAYPKARILSVGAARDDKPALEMAFDAGAKHGLFTWYWTEALAQAEPDQTWQAVFDRTRIWMDLKFSGAQQPQLSGQGKDAPILGGQFLPRHGQVVVKQSADQKVTLEVGQLTGATVGSKYAPVKDGQTATVTLTEVHPSFSLGDLQGGPLAPGDLLRETHHVYPGGAVRVFINGDAPSEQTALLAQLRGLFAAPGQTVAEDQLPGFERTDRQDQAQLILYALQPKRDAQGQVVYRDTLPDRDPQASLEVWVLKPDEQPVHERMQIRFADQAQGQQVLKDNLIGYRRRAAMEEMAQSSSTSAPITVQVIHHERCTPKQENCFDIEAGSIPGAPPEGLWYRKEGGKPIDMGAVARQSWKPFDLLSFRFENTGSREAYLYLYELRDDGSVAAVYPADGMEADKARIAGDKFLETAGQGLKVFLLIDKPGNFAFFTVISAQTLNSFLALEQKAYAEVRSKGTPLVPLEQLLVNTVHGTRGLSVGVKNGDWSTQLNRYAVPKP